MDETDEVLFANAQHARVVRGSTEEVVFRQEQGIIDRLVNKYRSGTLTDNDLRGSIGEIAGLRMFSESLEKDIRRGETAMSREFKYNG